VFGSPTTTIEVVGNTGKWCSEKAGVGGSTPSLAIKSIEFIELPFIVNPPHRIEISEIDGSRSSQRLGVIVLTDWQSAAHKGLASAVKHRFPPTNSHVFNCATLPERRNNFRKLDFGARSRPVPHIRTPHSQFAHKMVRSFGLCASGWRHQHRRVEPHCRLADKLSQYCPCPAAHNAATTLCTAFSRAGPV
jgi:hypothetical protein